MKISRALAFAFLSITLLATATHTMAAKDEWVQVKSKNFFLIGNAPEKEIRKVGTRLEQFRETFRLLFGKMNLTASIPTNVVVFKSDSYYKNFKPKRADGKIDNFVAGFFQPGEDVNYITLAIGGEEAQVYSIIFHEYVHFIVNANFGKSEVPAWFNEGLAEYYETFAIEDDQKVKLGIFQQRHLPMLQQNKLMPLGTLFGISNRQLLQTGSHSRSIFYAQSWALVHYLMQSGKSDGLSKFLTALLRSVPPEKAFQDAFQTTYAQMEKDLRKYVGQSRYQYNEITFKNKLVFDTGMRSSAIDDAQSNAYLGDLLYHTDRADDAEPYLVAALKLQPDSSMANTTLGMVKLKQRKFDEAKGFLEKAIAGDHRNHAALYRYAFLLSREGRDEFGYTTGFDKATAAKMREALRKAIAINPAFTESYELLAFVDLVNNEELDDAVAHLQTALKYQPGNQRYALRLAEIYSRQLKLAEALEIAEKIARTSDESDVKSRAASLLSQIAQRKEFEERNAAEIKRRESASKSAGGLSGPPRLIQGGKRPTEAEMAKQVAEAHLRSINESLRVPGGADARIIGRVQKIDCRKRPIVYNVKTATETFNLTSADFAALELSSFDPAAADASVGCDKDISALNALVTYRASKTVTGATRGELVAIEFVPANFRLMTGEEMQNASVTVYEQTDSAPYPETPAGLPPAGPPADLDAGRRAMMMHAIKDSLRKPADGEKREFGFLDKIECKEKGVFFHIRTAATTLRLRNSSPETLPIRVYTPDLAGLQFGCGIKPIEFPAVFIYTDKPDSKAKTAGEIVSVEFVPKTFILD